MIVIIKIIFKVQVRKYRCCSTLKPAETIATVHFMAPDHRVNALSLIHVNNINKLMVSVMLWGT